MKQAIIDIGSNSMRLTVYEVAGEAFKILFREKSMAGLAGYVEEGRLSPEGIARACSGLLEFRETLAALDITAVAVFATASLRNIFNTAEAVWAIQTATGFSVEVLSGTEEALLGYYGAGLEVHCTSGAFLDIGGGSTEITTFAADGPAFMESMPVGALRLHTEMVEKFLPKEAEVAQIQERVLREWKKIKADKLPHYDLLCAVGGTARAVLQLIQTQQAPLPDANSFTAEQFQKLKKQLLKRDEAAKKLILQVCPERVHTILPGILILDVIIRQLHTHLIYVSPYGVREGYLLRHYLS